MKLICCSRISSSGCQSRRQNCDVICLSGGISCFDLRFSYFVEYPGGLEPFLIMKKIYGFIVGRCAPISCKNTAGGAVTNKWKSINFLRGPTLERVFRKGFHCYGLLTLVLCSLRQGCVLVESLGFKAAPIP